MKKQKKILIIDDDPDIRKALRKILTVLGYKIFCADNGEKALEILSHDIKPSLIFCDIKMPKMNGLEFLSILRSEQHFGLLSIPVVVLSSEETVFKEVASFNAEFLNKSFDLEDIVNVVNRHCSSC